MGARRQRGQTHNRKDPSPSYRPVATAPYHAALDTPLLNFGGEKWCIRDAAEGTAIWGAPGSGKTSGSARTLAKAFLAAGMGGLVLCAKPDEADTWKAYAAAAGRSADLIIVDATAAHRFNILDYAAKHLAQPGFENNLVDLMARMAEAARVADSRGSGGSDGENKYFVDNAMKWVAHAFPLLLLAYDTIRLRDLAEFIGTAPQSPAQVPTAAKMAELRAGNLNRLPFFLKTVVLAGARCDAFRRELAAYPNNPALKARLDHALRLIDEHGDFFLDEYPRLDGKPRSSIESTLTSLIFPFLSGKLAELFCTTSTFSPTDCRDGAIIVMDLPVLKYQAGGAIAQTLFKYLFGVALQTIRVDDKTRPVFLFADEAQFFLNSADADLLSTARSSKICTVYITQDLPTYYAKLGSNSRDTAESILSKFGTRIFHANTSRETNQAAADLIGQTDKFHLNKTVSRGSSSGGGGNFHDRGHGGFNGHDGRNIGETDGLNGYRDHEITPDFFATKLRTGSKKHRYKVDGVVIRNARTWARTKRHWIAAEFSQR